MSAPLTSLAARIATDDAPAPGRTRFTVSIESWEMYEIIVDTDDADTARAFAKAYVLEEGTDPCEFVNAGFDIGDIEEVQP